jgi:protoheme IX farnesyltransferase
MRFGVILSLLSFAILWWGVNSLTAWLATGGLLFYVLVYTVWLKRRSPHNVVIGGAAGAFPPLVGWAAATGRLDLMAWLLAGIIFFWTPAHFWALALMRRHDYARARVPMLPVVRGDRAGRVQVARYTGLLVLVSITPFALGAMGPLYAAAALGLGMVLVERVTRLLRRADEVATRRYYFCSLFYLALLCLAMMVDRVFFVGP